MRDVAAPRHIGLRNAFREPLKGLLPLMGGQRWRPAKLYPTGLGTRSSIAGPRKDQLALELGQSTQNRQH
jgi:hypothetical protein